jgi:hypothetical protein
MLSNGLGTTRLLAKGDCPSRWLLIETIVPWRDQSVPTEADVCAFGCFRQL